MSWHECVQRLKLWIVWLVDDEEFHFFLVFNLLKEIELDVWSSGESFDVSFFFYSLLWWCSCSPIVIVFNLLLIILLILNDKIELWFMIVNQPFSWCNQRKITFGKKNSRSDQIFQLKSKFVQIFNAENTFAVLIEQLGVWPIRNGNNFLVKKTNTWRKSGVFLD